MPYQTARRLECERKFIVEVDPRFFARKRAPLKIVQGYIPTVPDHELRVRLINNRQAYVTRKEGSGYSRPEHEERVSHKAARLILDSCGEPIEKKRYRILRDNRLWELDIFGGKLQGLQLIEVEGVGRDEQLTFPPHVTPIKEVTYSLSNRHLAKFIQDREQHARLTRVDELFKRTLGRCVLTGGPASGKSTLMRKLRRRFSKTLHCVPEVATIIINQVGVKPPAHPDARRRFQREVVQIQLDFESISELQAYSDGKNAMLMDRGVLDTGPYFPKGLEEFDRVTQLNREYVHGLYDLVICLETPPRTVYERVKGNNKARYETYEQAVRTSSQTRHAWSKHPNFHFISNFGGWRHKVERVTALVEHFVQCWKF